MLPGKPVSDEIDEIDEIDEACALVRLRALRPQGPTVRPQRGSALFSGGVPKPRQFLKSVQYLAVVENMTSEVLLSTLFWSR